MLEAHTMSYPVTIQRTPKDITLLKWCLSNVISSTLSNPAEKEAALKAVQSDGAISTLLTTTNLPVNQLASVLLDYHLGLDHHNILRVYTVMLTDNRACEVVRKVIDGEEYIGVDLSPVSDIPMDDSVNFIVIDDPDAARVLGRIPWMIEFYFNEDRSVSSSCSFRSGTSMPIIRPTDIN